MSDFSFGVGLVEGFYGTPWSWVDRAYAAENLAKLGGKFYLYAPKGDPYLRKKWKSEIPAETTHELRVFGRELHRRNLSFGVGLSPYNLFREFDAEGRRALRRKLSELRALGIDHLSLLFDDMRGDLPGLGRLQTEILDFTREVAGDLTLSFCPTYYTDDPILDRVFGKRPERYFEEIARIDRSVHFFWTGEKVCSVGYTKAHLERVARDLGRKPLIWDNYPVNDGQRMCRYLHLSAFEGRGPELVQTATGIALNPMNQARLSWIPMRTLFESIRAPIRPEKAWMDAAQAELGQAFADALKGDYERFHRGGLDSMSAGEKSEFQTRYREWHAHPAGREILDWLDGRYAVTRELVLTQ